ncbi:MAG: hypothetical protein K6E17_04855 [Clostridiales bacterium]|nr:hypothetical protein [Clostridiales bacterium]
MKISTAFREAFRVYTRHFGDSMKFLLTELCLTLICLAPVLFVSEKPLRFLALIAVPMWIFLMIPARINAASAMQDSLGTGRLFTLRLADPSEWGGKILCGLKRCLFLLAWALPMIAVLVVYIGYYTGWIDVFVLMQKVQDFGGGDVNTGIGYLALIFLGTLVPLMIGIGYHSGARHDYVLGKRNLMKGHHGKNLLIWLCAQVTLLPTAVSAAVLAFRYSDVVRNPSGLIFSHTVKLPDTKISLVILGAGVLLTLILQPLRSLITASAVHQLAEGKE